MALPRWNNDAAVAALVDELVPKPHRDYLFEPWPVIPGVPMGGHSFPGMEREALEAARQGHFKMLGYLTKHYPRQLSPESMALIAARLQGKKAKRGTAKQTATRRRARNPVHDATDDASKIQEFLGQHYPGERGIRARAIDIAAVRAGISHERLANHFRSKHRLRHVRT